MGSTTDGGPVDLDILLALNGFAGRGDVLDALLVQLSASPVFKGIPLMMLVWGLWMVPHAHVARRRAGLAATLVTAVLALAAGRVLSMSLPTGRDRSTIRTCRCALPTRSITTP